MKNKIRIIVFVIVAVTCAVLILFTKPPFRNYVPVFWGIYGYAFHFFSNTIMQLRYRGDLSLSDEKKQALNKFYKINLILAGIAFILFAIFGIMTVVMTWKK